MKPDKIRIRTAKPEDAEEILKIYSYYVQFTAITYEYEVPDPDEFRERIRRTLQRYPYLVLEEDGIIRGYAYAGPLKERAAYAWSCETTIYLEHASRKKGYGRILYEALEAKLKEMGIRNLYACITCPEQADEYADRNSAEFHQHLGYEFAGLFHKCGYKFGRWYDTAWMEKLIGDHKC